MAAAELRQPSVLFDALRWSPRSGRTKFPYDEKHGATKDAVAICD